MLMDADADGMESRIGIRSHREGTADERGSVSVLALVGVERRFPHSDFVASRLRGDYSGVRV